MIQHYLWAGLDFMLDRDRRPVLLEANRSSHMLGEYLQYHGDERPFELTAATMNAAAGPACLLWRRDDPLPDADEDACYIGNLLCRHLDRKPLVCNVEDNQEPREELLTRDGRYVKPGSIFRWWYGLPWTYERAGVRVINPNAVWLAVRDKLRCYQALAGAKSFRVPVSFAVDTESDIREILESRPKLFQQGYVLKPRVGWGGYGVQVAEPGEPPRSLPSPGEYLLSERIVPQLSQGRFWDARAFVMSGEYLGGVRHSSRSPVTNYFQGAEPDPLDAETAAILEPAALEAVALLDAVAEQIHRQPQPPESRLTEVVYTSG